MKRCVPNVFLHPLKYIHPHPVDEDNMVCAWHIYPSLTAGFNAEVILARELLR